jgi:hypothetical protein
VLVAGREADTVIRAALEGRGFHILAGVLLTLGTVPQFLGPPIPDVSWLLYTAGRLLDGAELYRDVVEVNPPLIVWLNLLPVSLARALGLSDVVVYRVLIVAGALGSLALCRALVRPLPEFQDPLARRVGLLLAGFVLLPLAAADFGEREHLLLILALPYVMLAAARLQRQPVRPALAVLAGLMTGFAIALKPYFLLLPLAVEGSLLPARLGLRTRAELAAIAAVLLGYLVAVLLWARPYWDLVRELGPPYFRFLRESVLLTAVTGNGAGVALCAMLAYVALRERARRLPLATVLLAATIGLFASAALQQKGWRYHFYPSMGTGFLLLGVLVSVRPATRSLAGRIYRAAAVAVLVCLPLFIAAAGVQWARDPLGPDRIADPDFPALRDLIRREAPGGSVLVLSSNMASAFPLVPESGARWASRFPSVWMLAAAYQDEIASPAPLQYRDPAARTALEREMSRAVAADLRRERPDLVLVLRPGPDRWEWGVRRLDYVRYFEADPDVGQELQAYGYLTDVGEYRAFKRMPRGARRAPPLEADSIAPGPPPMALRAGLHFVPLGALSLLQAALFLVVFGASFARLGGPTEGDVPGAVDGR